MHTVRHQAILLVFIYERVDFLIVMLFILFTVVRVIKLSVDPTSIFLIFFGHFFIFICILYFCCIFFLLSQESDQCAI